MLLDKSLAQGTWHYQGCPLMHSPLFFLITPTHSYSQAPYSFLTPLHSTYLYSPHNTQYSSSNFELPFPNPGLRVQATLQRTFGFQDVPFDFFVPHNPQKLMIFLVFFTTYPSHFISVKLEGW